MTLAWVNNTHASHTNCPFQNLDAIFYQLLQVYTSMYFLGLVDHTPLGILYQEVLHQCF